jgi:sigma-E factor negative regulatory protein RseA
MKKQLADVSALLDDELDAQAASPIVDATLRDEALRDAWQTYVLIGDQLRGNKLPASHMTDSVMARVRDEPFVLAPRMLSAVPHRHHPLLALAASVAGVVVVGWLALFGAAPAPLTEEKLAAVAPASTFAKLPADSPGQKPLPDPVVSVQQDMKEYMLAHQTQAATFRLGHGVEHVRAVALVGKPVRP